MTDLKPGSRWISQKLPPLVGWRATEDFLLKLRKIFPISGNEVGVGVFGINSHSIEPLPSAGPVRFVRNTF